MNIVLIGQIASGKGTLSQNLQEEYGFEPISIGLLLRRETEKDTPEAKAIEDCLTRGVLVSDDLALKVLKKHLDTIGDKNIIFDGYPRNLSQAKNLFEIARIDKVIFLDVDESVIRDRFLGRRECNKCGFVSNINNDDYTPTCHRCGGTFAKRGDNNEDAMISKMKSFACDTLPVIEFFRDRGLLCSVDAGRNAEYTMEQVREIIKDI